MKVVLACNFPGDETLGSSRVPLRLARELGALGVDVDLVFASDLPQAGHFVQEHGESIAQAAVAAFSKNTS